MKAIGEIIRDVDNRKLSEAQRRRLLLRATSALGGIGLIAAAYPFVASMEPSDRARARGGAVEVDVSRLSPGELVTVAWRGKPVWVMRRTDEMVRSLQRPDPELADPMSRRSEQPKSCANPMRSERPGLFVALGVCTHLGCTPTLRLDDSALQARLHAPGGFLCPCHGSVYDLAGRVVKNVPAPLNLEIPNYRFPEPSKLRVG